MNYFFGINNEIFKSRVEIPIFKNRSIPDKQIKLYEIYIDEKKWKYTNIEKKNSESNFFIFDEKNSSNDKIYFLSKDKSINKFNNDQLENLNDFTDTVPAFRSNLKILIINGGFSSYQSEYPFQMIKSKGSIVSSVASLTNSSADKNYLIFKNIFHFPINEKFNGFFVDIKNKKIMEKFELITNYTNQIEINKKLLNENIFFVSQDYLGIPMYVSTKDNHISFEHTHPLHEYILSKNRYEKVKQLKEQVNEIIN